jgi:prolyl oligopeptidase
VLDPDRLREADGKKIAINNFVASPNGRYIAAVVSKADAELGELRLFDSRTSASIGTPIAGIWGELSATWLPDSRSFLYVRGAGALDGQGEPFGRFSVLRRRLSGGNDSVIAGWNAGYGPSVRERDWIWIDVQPGSSFAVFNASEGVSSDGRAYATPLSALSGAPERIVWRPVFEEKDKVRGTTARGHDLYVRTYADASRYRVLRYDLSRPGTRPIEVLPQQDGVIEEFAAAADGLYYVVRAASVSSLRRLQYLGAKSSAVNLPNVGAVSLMDAQPALDGVVFSLVGWTYPSNVFETHALATKDAGLQPSKGPAPGADWVAVETTCKSHDGVLVPMSIIHRKGLVKDGSHPTIESGYGGYGIPERAYFYARMGAFYEAGGVYADVKPRGGGAFGRDWYEAGKGATKSNTWKDMIACAQTLVEAGYTSRDKLAIEGTSMGGVAAGRAVTERPDLFAAAWIRVGITEVVRFIEVSSNGPNHELEMGTVKTESGIRQLLDMSTYHQIRDGERYPAILLTAGMNDNRVAPWIPFKTAARFQAATSSGRPVLLRVESAGGHGVTSDADLRNAEFADGLAFILWNTGAPSFQPAP